MKTHLHSSFALPHYMLILARYKVLTYTYSPDAGTLVVSVLSRTRAKRLFKLSPNDVPVYCLELVSLLLEHTELVYSAEGNLYLPGDTGVL